MYFYKDQSVPIANGTDHLELLSIADQVKKRNQFCQHGLSDVRIDLRSHKQT